MTSISIDDSASKSFIRELFLGGYTWREMAACRNNTEDLFVSMETKHPEDLTIKAKAICEDCVVKRECLNAALKNNEYGIWGGMTREERLALKRKIKASGRG